MSVGGIQSTFGNDHVGLIAATNASKYARTQQLSEDSASSSLNVPSDETTLGSSSASSTSQGLTAVQKAYESLRQADTATGSSPVGPFRFSGGPVRSRGVTTDPIQTHEPMPPVFHSPVGLPNPVEAHDPMPPIFGLGTNLPSPTEFHDPLDPPVMGTTTSVMA